MNVKQITLSITKCFYLYTYAMKILYQPWGELVNKVM